MSVELAIFAHFRNPVQSLEIQAVPSLNKQSQWITTRYITITAMSAAAATTSKKNNDKAITIKIIHSLFLHVHILSLDGRKI
jgi:hypothetical protein